MAITKMLQKTTEASYFKGSIPMEYKYTAGVAGELFLKALRDEGKLLAGVCPECGFSYLPARMFCERCFTGIEKFNDAGLYGILLAYTIAFENFKGEPLDEPVVYGLINIHGTDTTLIHRLGGKNMENLCIGEEIKAILTPKNKRQGQITDILYFEKV